MANLSTYGVVGNGVTDDTVALQAAFDSGNDLEANAGLTFLVSTTGGLANTSSLIFDASGNQTVDWNGGTMISNSSDVRFMIVDKPSGTLTMTDLTIDGNNQASRGIIAETPINLTNIDMFDLQQKGGTFIGYGILTRVGVSNGANGNNQGDSTIDNCNLSNFTSNNNDNVVGNQAGAIRGYQHVWEVVPAVDVTITYKNATLDGCWGEDGDWLVLGQQNVSLENSASILIFDNLYVTNWARRGAKLMGENVTIQNSTFVATPLGNSDPNFPGSSNLGTAGIIGFSQKNNAFDESFNQSLINCTITGRNGGYNDSWDVVTFSDGKNGKVENCTFNGGSELRYSKRTWDHSVCSTSFGAGSYIHDVAITSVNGVLTLDNGNTYTEGDWNRLGPPYDGNPGYQTSDGSLVFANLSCGPINFSTYGAAGNGTTDDTLALQSALDSETNLIADPGATFRITSRLDIDTSGNQTIDWNNSTIIVDLTSGSLLEAMRVDKPSGRLTMNNLTLDGNNENLRGLDIETVVTMDNITVTGQYQPSGNTLGIFGIKISLVGKENTYNPNAEGAFILTNIECHEINANENIEVGGSAGSATGMIIYWDAAAQNQTTLDITNLHLHDIFGSDSSCMYTDSRYGHEASLAATESLLTVTNGTFERAERRRGKLFGGHQTFNNCTFTSPAKNDLTMKYVKDNGGGGSCGGAGLFCDAGNVGITDERNTFNDCTFSDSADAYDPRIIFSNNGEVNFNRCSWVNGSDLAIFVDQIADDNAILQVCGSSFSTGSIVYAYGNNPWNGTITFDTGNVYADGYATTTAPLSGQDVQANLSCGAPTNFSAYGAVGDGIADDTAALQAALDAESNLIANPASTFLITGVINIDTQLDPIIDWNNSIMTMNSEIGVGGDGALKIDTTGMTTMSNLTFDGNGVQGRGIYMESRVTFNNINVTNIQQRPQGSPQEQSAAGFYIRIFNNSNAFGAWEFNNCTLTNFNGSSLGSESNCVPAGDLWGSVNGVLFYWQTQPSTETVLTWNNLTVDGMWGDDGGCFFTNDNVNIKATTSRNVFNNCTFKNAERRAIKGFSSNLFFNNCTFEDPDPLDSNLQCSAYSGIKSGMVVLGSSQRGNIQLDGCTFVYNGYDGRIIPIAVEDWSIKNSTFIGGAYIAMTNLNGVEVINGLIEANDFGTEGYISKYGTTGSWTDGTIGIDTNNTWGGGAADIRLDPSEYYTYTSEGGGGPNVRPSIILLGSQQIILNAGDSFIDPGATASDPEDGDITGNIITGGSFTNTNLPGDYTITYDIVDSGGLSAIQQTRFLSIRTPQVGRYLNGGKSGDNIATVAYIGDTKLRG